MAEEIGLVSKSPSQQEEKVQLSTSESQGSFGFLFIWIRLFASQFWRAAPGLSRECSPGLAWTTVRGQPEPPAASHHTNRLLRVERTAAPSPPDQTVWPSPAPQRWRRSSLV